MTTHLPDRMMGPRRIAVLSADAVDPPGSDDAVRSTLEKLDRVVDEVVLVDPSHGDAASHGEAFADLRRRLDGGELSPDDLVVTLDARRGCDSAILDDLQRLAVKERLDALLVRPDPAAGSSRRRTADTLVSWWASLWAGRVRFHHVRSDHRIFRLAPLVDALAMCADGEPRPTELAVVLSRMGARVRNDVLVPVPAAPRRRPDPLFDGVADLLAVPAAAFRVERCRSERFRGERRGDGPADAGHDRPPRGMAPTSVRTVIRLLWPIAITATLLLSGPLYLVGFVWRRRRGPQA